jgi:hypothetical protein
LLGFLFVLIRASFLTFSYSRQIWGHRWGHFEKRGGIDEAHRQGVQNSQGKGKTLQAGRWRRALS